MTKVVIPRGPYRTGIKRRREIVDAASRIFARYGYAGGSLRQIAGDVGVTPAALARHFDNKYGLLQAVLTHWEKRTTTGSRGPTVWSTSAGCRSWWRSTPKSPA